MARGPPGAEIMQWCGDESLSPQRGYSLPAAFADVSLLQLALVAGVALFASIVGGVTGYGSSALMPLVLVPLLGAAPVVPIVSVSGLFNNSSRAIAFRQFIDFRRAVILLIGAVPACMLGAYSYTKLTSAGVLIAIGTMLCLSVPLRRLLLHFEVRLENRGLLVGALVYGFLTGTTTGSGVILLSLLMAAGLQGAEVVATDALVSIAIAIAKIAVFGFSGALTPQVVAFGLLIGLMALPGAFLAKAFVEALPLRVHTGILDGIVILGGLTMLIGAVRTLT
jgi:uncharacterized membrane protein YfcA